MDAQTDLLASLIAYLFLILTILFVVVNLIGSLFSVFRFFGVLSAVADCMDKDVSDGSTELAEYTSDAATIPEEPGGLVETLLAGLFGE